jgi:hypothetical protein
LETLCAQVYAVRELWSDQIQAMAALVKLKGYGITEEHILSFNNLWKQYEE